MKLDTELFHPLIYHFFDLFLVHDTQRTCPLIPFLDGDIFLNGLGQEHALHDPLRRHISDAVFNTVFHGINLNFISADIDLPGICLVIPEQRLYQLCTPGTQKSGDSQDLSFSQGKIHVLKTVFQIQIFDLQDFLSARLLFIDKRRLLDFTPGHIICKFLLRQLGCISCPRVLSVSEDCKPLRNLKHLIQLVRYEQNRNILLLQITDHVEQRADFLLRNCRGGLIHDNQLRVVQKGTADCNQLFICNG